jgi:hypothetical protein
LGLYDGDKLMPASVGYYISDIASLRAIDASIRTDGYMRAVGEKKTWYMFFSAAIDAADNDNVVQPLIGTGRWFKIASLVLASDILNLSESIDDRIGQLFLDSATLDVVYNDVANSLTINVKPNSIGETEVSSLEITTINGLSSALADKAPILHTHSPVNITDLSEFIDDRVSALLQQGTGITINYNDTSNTLTISGQSVPLQVKNEGTVLGSATSLDVVGALANLTISGTEATLTITSPAQDKIEVFDSTNTSQGFVSQIRFTGSGVSSVTVANDKATIDITGGGSGTSTIAEQNYTVVSNSIASNGYQTISFPTEVGLFVRNITSNFFCRIRIYIDATSASNDLVRTVDTELQGEHGCLFEGVLTPTNLVLDLSPPVILYKKDISSPLFMTINNLDSSSRTFNIVLNTLKW